MADQDINLCGDCVRYSMGECALDTDGIDLEIPDQSELMMAVRDPMWMGLTAPRIKVGHSYGQRRVYADDLACIYFLSAKQKNQR